MSFEQKLQDLILKELEKEDKINALCDIQANLTYFLANIITSLHSCGINYPIEKTYLDTKRIYEENKRQEK